LQVCDAFVFPANDPTVFVGGSGLHYRAHQVLRCVAWWLGYTDADTYLFACTHDPEAVRARLRAKQAAWIAAVSLATQEREA
jgi:hypothetical protein